MMNDLERYLKNYNYINFSTGILEDDFFWFSATNYNGLYRYDLKHKKMERVATFPEDMLATELYINNIISISNKLFFIPANANNIGIYNKEKNSFKYIKVEETMGCKFSMACVFNKKIYIFPQCLRTPKIYKINIENDDVSYWSFSREMVCGDEGPIDIFVFGQKDDKKIWLGLGSKKGIAEINLETEEIFVHSINSADSPIRDLKKDGDLFYLLTWFGSIVVYDQKTKEERIIFQKKDEKKYYSRILLLDNSIWILPIFENHILKIDKTSGVTQEIEMPDDLEEWKRDGRQRAKVIDYMIDQNVIWMWPNCTNKILGLDIKTLKYKKYEVKLDEETSNDLQDLYTQKYLYKKWNHKIHNVMSEKSISLKRYIRCIYAGSGIAGNRKNVSIGKKIVTFLDT